MRSTTLRHRWIAPLLVGLAASACSPPTPEATMVETVAATDDVATTQPAAAVQPVRAFVDGDRIIIEHGADRHDFLAGVNLGVTTPGHYPGELAIEPEVYRRWFAMMSDLGISTIRVYTIQPPHFYEKLRAHNLAHPAEPLLLVHGVWIDEERFLDEQNLYDDRLTNDFQAELSSAVGAVAGDLTLPHRPGHASGHFTADVTPWLVAWIIGIEMDPSAVFESDAINASQPSYRGTYFSATETATATESWFAAQLDRLAAALAARGLAMPLAFTNWPTTDPLDHPYEPIEGEDLVGIDANHISPEAWNGGYFASYHAYPYYPDFQAHDPSLAAYEHNGRPDPYAGYLAALKEHHAGLPVVIAEFGVPGGMALAHRGPLGRDQGAHSEPDQMALNAEMVEVIHAEGLAGALLFEWADEWFKRTWNTMDLEQPADRRALWLNAFNNESQFGLLAVHPGETPTVVLDGDLAEWDLVTHETILAGDGAVEEVRATHDAGYLYLAIRLAPEAGRGPVTIGFDVLEGASGGLPGSGGFHPEADYAVVVGPARRAEAFVRASNDPFGVRYGLVAGYEPAAAEDFVEGSQVWNPQRLLTSHPLIIRPVERQVPADTFTTGALVYGSTDPTRSDFDSRAVWIREGQVVELRLPWATIGVSDPSSRRAVRVELDGTVTTTPIEVLEVTVVADGEPFETTGYGWETWDRAIWHDRLKVGAESVGAAIAAAARP